MKLAGAIGIGLLATAIVASTAICNEGFIHVHVREKQPGGTHLYFLVPAVLALAGMKFEPEQGLQDVAANLRPWLPAIRAATDALSRCPDVALVEVSGPKQHLRIAKSRGAIEVEVDDPEETIYVSVPLRAARSVVEGLSAMNRHPMPF